MPITHSKVSAIADGGDTDLVRPSDWNAGHVYPAGSVVQVVVTQSTTRDETTSATLQDSSLSATITPVYNNSKIVVEVSGECAFQRAAGSPTTRSGDVAIRNETNSVLMNQQTRGHNLVAASSISATAFTSIALLGVYTVNSTSARTFRLQYASGELTNVRAIILGDRTGGVWMKLTEIKV